jgi:uncharacterized protein YyaL (SSP411 family)
VQVLDGIHRAFTERRNEVEESASEFANHLAQQDTERFKKNPEASELNNDLESTYKKLEASFDKNWGGLEKEPKFIMPSVWLWLLRYFHLTKNEAALRQVLLTLKRVAMGGIYDQLGGGFARYSVDGYWFAPHFEKMLYDNAQLISLYSEAYAITKDEEFKTVIEETFEWLQTEMMHPEGGFYSALDADSEGEEGKFYVWQKKKIQDILKEDADLFCDYYSVKDEGNWEHGNNILFRALPDDKFLTKHSLTAEDWKLKLRKFKDKLLEVRDIRIKPGLDDKVITSWNAMMVCGLVDAFKATGDDRFRKVAVKNTQFLESELMEESTLYRSYKNKRSITKGFLDDYAYVIQAYLKLYQVTFEEYWIMRAKMLAEHVIDNFFDSDDGFFHYTGKYGEKLIASKKEIFDNVIPASNSVMAQNLFHLAIFFDSEEWKTMALRMTLSLGHLITSEPNYMSNWAIVYTEMKKGMAEVSFVGSDVAELDHEFHKSYQPFALTMGTVLQSSLPLLDGKVAVDNKTTIYVCYDKTCQRPVHSINEALKLLK